MRLIIKLKEIITFYLKIIIFLFILSSFFIVLGVFYEIILNWNTDKIQYIIYFFDFEPITNQWVVFCIFLFLFFLFTLSNGYRYHLGYYDWDISRYTEKLKNASFFSSFKFSIFLQKLYDGLLCSIFVGCFRTEILKSDLVTSKYFESIIIQRVWDIYEKKFYLLDLLNEKQQNITESTMNMLLQSTFLLKELKIKLNVTLQQNTLITNLKKKVLEYCSDNKLELESSFNLKIENLFKNLQNNTILEFNNNISYNEKFKVKHFESIIQEQRQSFDTLYNESENEIFKLLEEFKNLNLHKELERSVFGREVINTNSNSKFIVDFTHLYNYAIDLYNYAIANPISTTTTIFVGFLLVVVSLVIYEKLQLTLMDTEFRTTLLILKSLHKSKSEYNPRSFPTLHEMFQALPLPFRVDPQFADDINLYPVDTIYMIFYLYKYRSYLDFELEEATKNFEVLTNNPQEFIEFLKKKLDKSIITEEDLKSYKLSYFDLKDFIKFISDKKQ